jgi:hypothetical protein
MSTVIDSTVRNIPSALKNLNLQGDEHVRIIIDSYDFSGDRDENGLTKDEADDLRVAKQEIRKKENLSPKLRTNQEISDYLYGKIDDN